VPKKDTGINEIKDLLSENLEQKIMLGVMEILKHNGVEEFYYSSKFAMLAWNDKEGVGHKYKNYEGGTTKRVNIKSVMTHGK